MSNLDISSDKVLAAEDATPVKISIEDYDSVKEIQLHVDSLTKYRAEVGRLTQLIGNLCIEANRIEQELADKRRALATKYNLEQAGTSQWVLDFETNEFIKVKSGAPVIP